MSEAVSRSEFYRWYESRIVIRVPLGADGEPEPEALRVAEVALRTALNYAVSWRYWGDLDNAGVGIEVIPDPAFPFPEDGKRRGWEVKRKPAKWAREGSK